jgi:hypothetical protein
VNTRTPLLRSVVVSAISASWLATLTEARGYYQTATTGRLRRHGYPITTPHRPQRAHRGTGSIVVVVVASTLAGIPRSGAN